MPCLEESQLHFFMYLISISMTFHVQETVNSLYSDGNFLAANYCSDVLYRLRQVGWGQGGGTEMKAIV